MLRPIAILGALILSASCSKSESRDSAGSAPLSPSAGAGSAKAGGGGGFSADLAKELGSGGAAGSDAAGAGSAPAGSDAKAAGTTVVAAAGSDAKAGDAKAGSAAPTLPPTVTAKPGDPKPGDAKASDGKPGSAVLTATVPAPYVPPKIDPKAPVAPAPVTPEHHGPVRVSPELAAIKLSLLPNWDRDVDEAGTFQYVVRIKGTQNTKTFSFHYGYDDPKAPVDRDQYKKYLQDTKALTGELKDRQRGSAWFLEGADASGAPAFRYQVLYGGKRLVCYGSLYKDAEGSRLGDDRDQTVIQAKQICETLAL